MPYVNILHVFCVFVCYSQGDGHFFPLRTLCESENPLLANEEQWLEDGGSDEESAGEINNVSKLF